MGRHGFSDDLRLVTVEKIEVLHDRPDQAIFNGHSGKLCLAAVQALNTSSNVSLPIGSDSATEIAIDRQFH